MDKRTKNKKHTLLLIGLLCLLFVPQYGTEAYFADTVSESAGIELTLGSVELSVEDGGSNQEQPLTIENGSSQTITERIQNTGTLTGKIAYDISFTNAVGKDVSGSLEDIISISMNGNEMVNYQKTLLMTDSSDNPAILEPGETKDISIRIEANSLSKQMEEINLNIDFLLFQTNGTLDKPLFHDVAKMSYRLKMKKDDFWPEEEVKEAGKIKYAIKLPETFYFTTKVDRKIFGEDEIYHQSINYGILYLESDEKINDWYKTVQTKNSNISVTDIEVSEDRAKVYFRLNKKNSSEETNRTYYQEKSKFVLEDLNRKKSYAIEFKYNASQIFLSSDNLSSDKKNIEKKSINLNSWENKKISLQYISIKDNYEVKNIVLNHSFLMDAFVYIDYFLLDDVHKPLIVDEDFKIELPNGGFFEWITDKFYNPELQIQLRNQKSEENIEITRQLTYNILDRNFSNSSREVVDYRNASVALNKQNILFVDTSNVEEVKDEQLNKQSEEKGLSENKNSEVEKEILLESNKDNLDLGIPTIVKDNPIGKNQMKNEEEPQQSTETLTDLDEPSKAPSLPKDESFEYMNITIKEEEYSIGIEQSQLDWIFEYSNIQEFTSHLREDTTALYVKYDKITGIKDIEQFVYDLAEQKQIDFDILLKDHPEQKILEITFTK